MGEKGEREAHERREAKEINSIAAILSIIIPLLADRLVLLVAGANAVSMRPVPLDPIDHRAGPAGTIAATRLARDRQPANHVEPGCSTNHHPSTGTRALRALPRKLDRARLGPHRV